MSYKEKYIKYKNKYLELKKTVGFRGGSQPPQLSRVSSEPQLTRGVSDETYGDGDFLFTRFYNDPFRPSLHNRDKLPYAEMIFQLNEITGKLKEFRGEIVGLSSVILFEQLQVYLHQHFDSIADNTMLENLIRQFYYYELYRMYTRNLACIGRLSDRSQEVYLVMQNAYDDSSTFAASTVIYPNLAAIARQNNTELLIYHTLDSNPVIKSQLERSGANLTLNNSLRSYQEYLDVIQKIANEGKKISFLYFSSHGNYISPSHTDSSVFGYYYDPPDNAPPTNLPIQFLDKLFREFIGPSLTFDCNVVLNSCWLGQTSVSGLPVGTPNAAEIVSRCVPNNVVIAARGPIRAGSFEQSLLIDEITKRLVFVGNVVSGKGDYNRFYGYCQNATDNTDTMRQIIDEFKEPAELLDSYHQLCNSGDIG